MKEVEEKEKLKQEKTKQLKIKQEKRKRTLSSECSDSSAEVSYCESDDLVESEEDDKQGKCNRESVQKSQRICRIQI